MPEPVHIKVAADLFQVLVEGTAPQQFAVLRSILQKPERALLLGSHEGEDFIDLLVRLIPQAQSELRKMLIVCLSCYDEPRATEFLLHEFERSRDAAAVFHLAARLSIDRNPGFFRAYLWRDNRSAQATASARLLRDRDDLEAAELLRIAVLLPEECRQPPIDEEHLELWLQELGGRHRLKARRLAEQRGREALLLWSSWERLQAEEREWLVELTLDLDSDVAKERIDRLLGDLQVPEFVVKAAVSLGLSLPSELLRHPDAGVRAPAIASGLADSMLESFLGPQVSAVEAAAAAGRCSADRLLELLADDRWQVRSVAAQALSRLKQPPLEALREKAQSTHEAERAAAVSALLSLGDEAWLAEWAQTRTTVEVK